MQAILTHDNDIKERLSVAYLTALAARAGCQIFETKVDRNGIDATLSAIKGTSAKLDVQLKATAAPVYSDDHLAFDLEVHTYNKLREPNTQSPAVLVVLVLPEDTHQWLVNTYDDMVLRSRAHWVNLAGAPASTNAATQRVHLPRTQVLNTEVLVGLFETMESNLRKGVAAL
ncbi:MAG: hypothetical protein RL186_509 [Pseudomonadota bacterium]